MNHIFDETFPFVLSLLFALIGFVAACAVVIGFKILSLSKSDLREEILRESSSGFSWVVQVVQRCLGYQGKLVPVPVRKHRLPPDTDTLYRPKGR